MTNLNETPHLSTLRRLAESAFRASNVAGWKVEFSEEIPQEEQGTAHSYEKVLRMSRDFALNAKHFYVREFIEDSVQKAVHSG